MGRDPRCVPWRRLALWLALVLLLAGCSRSVLYSHLDEQQANEVVAALIDHNIDARKQPAQGGDGWEVLLDRHDIPTAMAVLHNAGLPHKSTDVSAFFQKQGFVSSPVEDKHRYIYAREQQLDKTLRQLDGVVDAYVYLSIPDKNPISEKPVTGSASVVIIARPDADIKSQVTDIKAAVMNGTQGLTDPTRVSVTTFRRAPVPVSQAVPAPHAAAMGGMVGWVLLIAVAALAVLLAALLLWRNRQALVGARRVRNLNRAEDGK